LTVLRPIFRLGIATLLAMAEGAAFGYLFVFVVVNTLGS